MAYGLKDAANLHVVNKRTGNVDLYIDYANATSSEWTADRIYATKKGTNAITWDANRAGTLTLDTEVFDLGLLAMAIGSEVKEGEKSFFRHQVVTIDDTRKASIEGNVDPNTVSVVKLGADSQPIGQPLTSTTGSKALLPEIVSNVTVGINDKSAVVTFDESDKAVAYEIYRDGSLVGTTGTTSFTDEGLTAATEYRYTVKATNDFGSAPISAEVVATSTADGVTTRVNKTATEEAITAAEKLEGQLNEAGTGLVTFDFAGGTLTFSEKAVIGDVYAVYYAEKISGARTITVASDVFPDSYEIYGDVLIRNDADGSDEFCQIHYKNARPQSNLSLTQSATEPTSLSITFDLTPDKDKQLAEYKFID